MGFKEFLQSLGYTDEQITAIIDGMKTNKIYLSKEENIDTRYEKLKGQKTDLETQLATANQTIENLKKDNKDNEALQTKVTEYETTIETLKTESANKIKQLTIATAIKGALVGADEKYHALLEKAFDTSKVVVNDDGTLTGFNEQVEVVKTQYADLFTATLGGNTPPAKTKSPYSDKNPWSKEHFNLTEQARILRENPQLAEQLKNSK